MLFFVSQFGCIEKFESLGVQVVREVVVVTWEEKRGDVCSRRSVIDLGERSQSLSVHSSATKMVPNEVDVR